MARPRIHDHDAILNRWADGMPARDIGRELGIPYETVSDLIAEARRAGDPRAVLAADRRPPLAAVLGIKAETRFVPTLIECGQHWHRTPVTVASLRGGPVVYENNGYRRRYLPGLIAEHVSRAVMMHSEAAE